MNINFQNSMEDDPANGSLAALYPELRETEYLTKVLQVSSKTEEECDGELLSQAHAAGISATLPSISENSISSVSSDSSFETSYQDKTFSSGSNGSVNTFLTPDSSIYSPPSPALPSLEGAIATKTLSFNYYEKYLAHLDPALDQDKQRKASPESSGRSVFSVTTRKSFSSVKASWKNRIKLGKKISNAYEPPPSCETCQEDFTKALALHSLPCGHVHCAKCLRSMVGQATTEESKMPPQCCSQPIPASLVQGLLDPTSQIAFLKAVVQYSTPWKSRVFCPNSSCGEFIPPRAKVDPKQPFTVTCHECETRVCVLCKGSAHRVGKDCPRDLELQEKTAAQDTKAWKRCYKCRVIVEMQKESSHTSCQCTAQFCSICGGIWDAASQCPNLCHDEAELEKRRAAEEKRLAEEEAARQAEETAKRDAVSRTMADPSIKQLQNRQHEEMTRFIAYVEQTRESMRYRQSERKKALSEKQIAQEEAMKEKHAKGTALLEDRQVAAEIGLRSTLEQSERSVNVRLKHMEAYCNGLGRNPSSDGKEAPAREVTERDLRELGRQYTLRDGMERANQAKINVMRDRQEKAMADLLDRQETELEKLLNKREAEVEDLATQLASEEASMNDLFKARQGKQTARWNLAIEILCKELEERNATQYALVPVPIWPSDTSDHNEPTILVKEA